MPRKPQGPPPFAAHTRVVVSDRTPFKSYRGCRGTVTHCKKAPAGNWRAFVSLDGRTEIVELDPAVLDKE